MSHSTSSIRGLADEDARRRIRFDHDTTLVVEAAAGTGKTTALVRRVVELLAAGRARVHQVAAITFTEKAGGELRLRIREGIEDRIGREMRAGNHDVARRLEQALARLEEALVGTIHSFCATLLRERPIEAGVDPDFAILQGRERDALFDRVFRQFLSARLDRPGGPGAGIARLFRRVDPWRNPVELLREAALALLDGAQFDAGWTRRAWEGEQESRDLVEKDLTGRDAADGERVFPGLNTIAAARRRVPRPRPGGNPNWLRVSLANASELAREIRVRREAGLEDPAWLEQRLAVLRVGAYSGRDDPVEPVRPLRDAFRERLAAFQESANADLAARLREELRPLIAAYRAARKRAGKLDFDDLLEKTRGLLIGDGGVRRELQARFRQILVDEVQDTDPIQTEIVMLLTAREDPPDGDWTRAVPVPGSLFLVGDPKQSIYSFRRADVRHYLRTKEHLLRNGADEVRLTTNFRAVPGLCDFVNRVMAPVFREHEGTEEAVPYAPLLAHAAAVPEARPLAGIPVPDVVNKRDLARKEPRAVAEFVRRILASGRLVRSLETGAPRPVREADICLLFRRFRSFRRLVPQPYADALREQGITCSLADVQSYIRSPEVTALRAALTAVEFPQDEINVYAALRSPLFSIPDEQLFAFRVEDRGGGRLRPRPAPSGAGEATPAEREVHEALAFLSRLHGLRNRRPIAVTIQQLLARYRGETVFGFSRSPAQTISNLRRVAEEARAFEAAGGLSFRAFVEALAERAERPDPGGRNIVDEDVEGVRILTMHAAKGLEFPVVVLCDAACPREPTASRYSDPKRRLYACDLGHGVRPWDLLDRREEVEGRERRELDRLLYVAATRARDLLAAPVATLRYPFDSLLAPITAGLANETRPLSGPAPEAPGRHGKSAARWRILTGDAAGPAGKKGVRAEEAFLRRRQAARDSGSVVSQRSATGRGFVRAVAVHDGVKVVRESVPRDGPRPEGAGFGNLVHRLLERIPFEAGEAQVREEADRLVRREGFAPALAAPAAAAVTRALRHELFRAARGAAVVYRELPLVLRSEVPASRAASEDSEAALDAAAQSLLPGPVLVDGVADLVFQTRAGGPWTVVDYKTRATPADDSATAGVDEVDRRQVALYAEAVSRATGQPARAALLFL